MSNTINHNTLGDVQEHEYLPGVVLAVYPEDPETPEENWDTADVYIEELGLTWYHAPIFYHCSPDVPLRANGAIFDGARGFTENDRVILFCKIQTAQTGKQLVTNVKLISHEDGVRKCAYNFVIVRASLSSIEPINLEAPNTEELVTVYDVVGKCPAVIIDPDTGDPLEYPCSIDKLLPFLAYAEFKGVDLFEYFDQGDDQIQVAGAVPNWTEDYSGEDVRGDDGNWWTTYDHYGNPVQSFFESVCFGIMTDNEGASDGSFSKAMGVVDRHQGRIETWDIRSNAFRTDNREYDVTGPEQPELPRHAIDVKGFPLDKATSQHIQTAYGENEIWVCAVTSYMGIIVSYCDEMWEFKRLENIPTPIAIPGVIENWQKIANKAPFASLGGGLVGGSMLGDISAALAADITLQGKGGENSIWSIGALKRINEGAFHRTIHPALSGSQVMRTTAIPEDINQEPPYLAALNRRWDKIDAWYRYDNWHNTMDLAFGTFGVDVTWWFKSIGIQWGSESIYADTPLGSMWLQAPNWRAAVWSMPSLSVAIMAARRDHPLSQKLITVAKHSRAVVCQLYVAQRTSVTLWAEKEGTFMKQEIGKGPYFSVAPEEDGSDAIAYIKLPDTSTVHIDSATPEQIESVLSDREILTSDDPDHQAFKANRNEFEIMGAADLYGELMTQHERRSPLDQTRTPEFEQAVAALIDGIMDEAETSFDEIFLDMEIV